MFTEISLYFSLCKNIHYIYLLPFLIINTPRNCCSRCIAITNSNTKHLYSKLSRVNHLPVVIVNV